MKPTRKLVILYPQHIEKLKRIAEQQGTNLNEIIRYAIDKLK